MRNRRNFRWEFAQSSRGHLIARERIREVLTNPIGVLSMEGVGDQDERVVFLGMDKSGRAIEVVAVESEQGLLVIHAMDMRPKWRLLLSLAEN